MTDFAPASWPEIMRGETYSVPSHTCLYLKRLGSVFHGQVSVGIVNMHVILSHLPPSQKPNFVDFDNVSCCVFVCTVFHFYKPLYWCLEQSMLHTSTLVSLYMKLYFYKNATLQKGLLWLMLAFNLKSLQCLSFFKYLMHTKIIFQVVYYCI